MRNNKADQRRAAKRAKAKTRSTTRGANGQRILSAFERECAEYLPEPTY